MSEPRQGDPVSSQAMRIGITCYPTFGGSGIIATEVGQSLARRGHHVHFICSDVPSRLDRLQSGVFFHPVEVRDYPLFDHSVYPLALASKMVEVSKREQLDVLHVHYAIPHATSAYLARQVLVDLGERSPRIVTTLHGTDITLIGNDPSFLPITRFSIAQSSAVTVPSRYLKAATYANFDIPTDVSIEVIPNFVDADRFRPAAARRAQALRSLFNSADLAWDDPNDMSSRPRILIHNSNFRPLKRVGDVVRILAEVRRALPALLVLVGDGPERPRIESMVRKMGLSGAVCFLGEQRNFLEVLQSSDVFLLPSETESFGLAALEALSCGVPVVASRVGGIPEVVVDGESGQLFEVGDVGAMAAGVLALLRDPALHERMARTARAQVERQWQREPIVTRYEDCYRRVVNELPGRGGRDRS